jgi:hypothetical protein
VWYQWIAVSQEGNGILWLVTNWEPQHFGAWSGSSWQCSKCTQFYLDVIVWYSSSKWIPLYFMKYYKIELTSKCVKCVDNHAATSWVNQSQGTHSCCRGYSNDIDIVTIIVDCLKASTLHHRLRWVKDHQDEKIPYAELDLWGWLNCNVGQTGWKISEIDGWWSC